MFLMLKGQLICLKTSIDEKTRADDGSSFPRERKKRQKKIFYFFPVIVRISISFDEVHLRCRFETNLVIGVDDVAVAVADDVDVEAEVDIVVNILILIRILIRLCFFRLSTFYNKNT